MKFIKHKTTKKNEIRPERREIGTPCTTLHRTALLVAFRLPSREKYDNLRVKINIAHPFSQIAFNSTQATFIINKQKAS